MTRGTMRTRLRQRINEVAVMNWSDDDLNEILNLGAHRVQKAVMMVNPLAFIYKARTDIEAGEELYSKPVGFWYEFLVRLKDTSTGLYTPLEKRDYNLATDATANSGPYYSHLGRFVAINPIPAANITAGLEFLYVPLLSMAVDSDVIDINPGLHDAVVWAALLKLLPETGDATEEARRAYADEVSDIPFYYRISAGEPERLIPDLDKGY